jgi:hypothetical protein
MTHRYLYLLAGKSFFFAANAVLIGAFFLSSPSGIIFPMLLVCDALIGIGMMACVCGRISKDQTNRIADLERRLAALESPQNTSTT